MILMASPITCISIFYPTVCSGIDQRRYQSSVWGEFSFDVIMSYNFPPCNGACFTNIVYLYDDIRMWDVIIHAIISTDFIYIPPFNII